MVKKIPHFLVVVMLLMSLPLTAFASAAPGYSPITDETQGYGHQTNGGQGGGYPIQYSSSLPYPIDIQTVNIGGVPYIHKTYSVMEGTDPQSLVEETFKQAGFQYRYYEIIQQELIPFNNERQETRTETKECNTNQPDEVLALFDSSMPFDDGQGFTGTLTLQPQSLTLLENGRENYTYNVTDTREFPGLSRNDTSTIPKSVVKNGAELSLQTVDWIVTGSENTGYSAIPTSYTAVAYYSGSASGSRVNGYTATVSYSGTVEKKIPGRAIYTIVYEGERIIVPVNYMPYLLSGLLAVLLFSGLIVFLRLRPNVTIYKVIDGIPELYKKMCLNTKKPIVDLSTVEGVPTRLVFEKGFAKRLLDRKVFVVGRYLNYSFEIPDTCVQELGAQYPENKEKAGSISHEVI